MSRVRANKLTNRAGSGAPQLTYGAEVVVGYGITGAGGVNIAGVATAGAFVGNLTGNVTGNADTATSATTATSAAGITGTPDISVKGVNSTGIATAVMFSGNVTGTAATFTSGAFSGNISVANISASNGVKITGAGITATGIGTFHEGLHLENLLAEEVNVTAGKLSDNLNIDVENGMVHLFTTAESTTSTPNIRYNGSVALNTKMSIGQSIVVTLITTANASAYSANMTIDGGAQTERWVGGSAPSDGGGSGVDIHSFTIIKTADATFTVIGNHSKTS
jgi:hypothetical protein